MTFGTIYLVCAIAGGTILVLRIALMVIGVGGHENLTDAAATDLNHDGVVDDPGGTFHLLSLQSVAGFFTMFGLVGLGLLEINAGNLLSLLGAFAAGLQRDERTPLAEDLVIDVDAADLGDRHGTPP